MENGPKAENERKNWPKIENGPRPEMGEKWSKNGEKWDWDVVFVSDVFETPYDCEHPNKSLETK